MTPAVLLEGAPKVNFSEKAVMASNLNSTELSNLTTDEASELDYISGLDSSGTPIADSFVHDLNGPNASVMTYGNGSTVSIGFYSDSVQTNFTSAEEDNAWQALQLWSGLANINFVYTGDSNTSATAGTQVNFVHALDTYGTTKLPAGTLYANTGSTASGTTGIRDATSGYIQIDNTTEQKDSDGNYVPGTLGYGDIGSYTADDGYGIDTLVHEVGHLMGLGHGGNYNGTVDPSTQQRSEYDTRTWSIMSYIDPGAQSVDGNTEKLVTPKYEADYTVASDFDNEAPFTPMGLDIFAAQRIDGAPTSTMFNGGQTFGFNSTVMYTALNGQQQTLSMYDFTVDVLPVVTLYDYGGGNTLDLSGFKTAQTIDLNDGTFSSVAGLKNNLFIEWGTQIDRLIGGQGDDAITLNARADYVDGGDGDNTAILPGARASYELSLSGSDVLLTQTETGVSDDLQNIQTFQFSDGSETLADLERPGRTLDGALSPVSNAGQLTITANQVVTLEGSIANTGSIVIDGDAGSGAAVLAIAGDVTLSGGGTVTLADLYDGTYSTVAVIEGFASTDGLDNLDNTISGYGEIGQGTLNLVNEAAGTVVASSNTLTLDTGTNTITNYGLMQGLSGDLTFDSPVINYGHINTSSGGSLTLSSVLFNSQSVTIGPAGTLYLADGTLAGAAANTGVFDVATAGAVEVTSSGTIDGRLQTVELEGAVTIDPAASLTLTGAIQNTGTLKVEGNASSGDAMLLIAGNVFLAGGGLVELLDLYNGTYSTVALIQGAPGIDVLDNVDNSITGYGEIIGSSLTLVNGAAGSITATDNSMTLATGDNIIVNEGQLGAVRADLVIDSGVEDDGSIVAQGLGDVLLYAGVTGNGTLGVANDGTVELAGASVASSVYVHSYAHGLIEITASGSLDGSTQALDLGGITRVDAGGSLTLTGQVYDAGSIEVDGNASTAHAILDISGTATLSGGGTLVLADLYDGTYSTVAVVTGAGGPADLLDNAVDTIEGYGELGAGALSFTNETSGVVAATANTLTLHTLTTRNAGVVKALAHATLVIETTVDDAGGDIVAAGGTVQLGGEGVAAVITAGTLSGSDGGTVVIDSSGATLDGSVIAGNALIDVSAGSVLTVEGTLTNGGTIAIDGNQSVANATMLIAGAATLSGAGSVTLSDLYDGTADQVAVITGSSTSDTLDNNGNTIQGYGRLGAGTLAFTNEASGVVDATANTLTLDTGVSIITNHGLLEATGGTLAIDSSMASTGQLVAAAGGTLALYTVVNNSGSVQVLAGGRLVLAGGDVSGTGSVSVAAQGVAEVDGNSLLDGSNGPLTLAGTLTVDAGAVLTVFGKVDNSGTIAIDGNASTAVAILHVAGTARLTGGGVVNLLDVYDGTYSTVAGIAGSTGNDLLDNVDNTIAGYGIVGAGTLAITNEAAGLIDATANSLTLRASDTRNTGILEASANATLVIEAAVDGSGGHIVAAGGTVQLGGDGTAAVITAGTLSASGGGTIVVGNAGATLDAVSIAGSALVAVVAGSKLTVEGVLANSGAIAIDGNASTAAAILNVAGTARLTGGGTVNLLDVYGGTDSAVAGIAGSTGNDLLDNVDNTIAGYGSLGAGTLNIVNDAAGIIDATANTLTVNGGTGGIINRGLLEATGTSNLELDGAVDNAGGTIDAGSGTLLIAAASDTVQNSGVIHLAGGTITAAALSNSGTIDGHGVITAATANTGTIKADGGTMTVADAVSGSVSIAADSVLDLVGGVLAGTSVSFEGEDSTLSIDGGGTMPVSVTGFGPGDTILLRGVAYDPGGSVTLQAGNRLVAMEDGLAYDVQLDPAQSYGGETFTGTAASDGSLQLTLSETGPLQVPRGGRLIVDASASATGAPISIASGGTGAATLQVDGTVMPDNVIEGLAAGDVINLADVPFDLFGTAQLEPGNVLQITDGGQVFDLALDPSQSFANDSFILSDPIGTDVTVTSIACYVRGTRIATPSGDVAVENLRVTGSVLTASGVARPICWIGRRSYAGRFLAANPNVRPVRFRSGSLGDGLPRRDLLVSPDHAMFLDCVLIPARHLTNGTTICEDAALDRVDYFHIELEDHDVILAEGAPSETFIDDASRGMFHNAADYLQLFPGAPKATGFCAPRVESGCELEAIRTRLKTRSKLHVVAA